MVGDVKDEGIYKNVTIALNGIGESKGLVVSL